MARLLNLTEADLHPDSIDCSAAARRLTEKYPLIAKMSHGNEGSWGSKPDTWADFINYINMKG
jgi:hypothetical protein